MTDKDLVKAAARAAGINGRYESGVIWYRNPFGDDVGFNPLRSDGDAFRLAVKLHLYEALKLSHRLVSGNGEDAFYAAARRAVVVAAAEIDATSR